MTASLPLKSPPQRILRNILSYKSSQIPIASSSSSAAGILFYHRNHLQQLGCTNFQQFYSSRKNFSTFSSNNNLISETFSDSQDSPSLPDDVDQDALSHLYETLPKSQLHLYYKALIQKDFEGFLHCAPDIDDIRVWDNLVNYLYNLRDDPQRFHQVMEIFFRNPQFDPRKNGKYRSYYAKFRNLQLQYICEEGKSFGDAMQYWREHYFNPSDKAPPKNEQRFLVRPNFFTLRILLLHAAHSPTHMKMILPVFTPLLQQYKDNLDIKACLCLYQWNQGDEKAILRLLSYVQLNELTKDSPWSKLFIPLHFINPHFQADNYRTKQGDKVLCTLTVNDCLSQMLLLYNDLPMESPFRKAFPLPRRISVLNHLMYQMVNFRENQPGEITTPNMNINIANRTLLALALTPKVYRIAHYILKNLFRHPNSSHSGVYFPNIETYVVYAMVLTKKQHSHLPEIESELKDVVGELVRLMRLSRENTTKAFDLLHKYFREEMILLFRYDRDMAIHCTYFYVKNYDSDALSRFSRLISPYHPNFMASYKAFMKRQEAMDAMVENRYQKFMQDY